MPQVNTKRGTASTTPAELVALDSQRADLYITNEDAAIIIRIGDSTVVNASGSAAAAGLAIMPGQTLPLLSNAGGSIVSSQQFWVVSDSGTPAYSVLEYREVN